MPYVKTNHTISYMRKILTLLVLLFTVAVNLLAQSKKIKEADIQVKITRRIESLAEKR